MSKQQLPEALAREARLKVDQVATLVGWSRGKVYQQLKAGAFPEPERRGVSCTRWRAGDVIVWLGRTRNT